MSSVAPQVHSGLPKIFLKIDVHIENCIFFSIVRGGSVPGVSQQTHNVIVTFCIGFKIVTLNLTFLKRF